LILLPTGEVYPKLGRKVKMRIILGEADVEKVNTVPVYKVGEAIGALYNLLVNGASIYALARPAAKASEELNAFSSIKSLNLSKDAAKEICSRLDELWKNRLAAGFMAQTMPAVLSEKHYLTDIEAGSLIEAILRFQFVLCSELPQQNIYYTTPKLAYDMDVLINNGERVLPEDVFDSLGASKDRVINDIRESAKCLAFGIATAAGFHIYRAIECIVVEEYFPLLGITQADYEKNPNLGNYIKLLKEKELDAKVTEMLSHIKDEYRNPISHPEEFWDISKAGSALAVAHGIITMMLRDISNKKLASPAGL
jgi:hypothetical protein